MADAQKDTARCVSRLGLEDVGRPLAACYAGPKRWSACLRSWTARAKSYVAAVIWARSEETNVSSNPIREGQAIIARAPTPTNWLRSSTKTARQPVPAAHFGRSGGHPNALYAADHCIAWPAARPWPWSRATGGHGLGPTCYAGRNSGCERSRFERTDRRAADVRTCRPWCARGSGHLAENLMNAVRNQLARRAGRGACAVWPSRCRRARRRLRARINAPRRPRLR